MPIFLRYNILKVLYYICMIALCVLIGGSIYLLNQTLNTAMFVIKVKFPHKILFYILIAHL